jgi:hypothetical protein
MLLEDGAESVMEGASWLADGLPTILLRAASSPTPFGFRVIVILIPSPTAKRNQVTELLKEVVILPKLIHFSQKISGYFNETLVVSHTARHMHP